MKKICFLFLILGTFWLSAQSNTDVWNILDFGAIPDGKTRNTEAINNAISKCNAAGGGTVYVPAGTFVSGSIQLRSNVDLHLAKGALIKGSSSLRDYNVKGIVRGLIYAFEAQNISITGLGTIDGNSDVFFNFSKKHDYVGFEREATRQGKNNLPEEQSFFADGPVYFKERPDMMVVLLRCEQILIRDVSFINSPNWSFRIGDSDDVKIRGIRIANNLLVPNSDGIHCTTSRNVTISDCHIYAGDDAIAITGFGDETGVGGRMNDLRPDYSKRSIGNKVGKCENIVVNNCVLHSRSAGVRIGYGDNDIRNVLFQNLVIYDSNRGLGIFNRDRANIENIKFHNIQIETRLYEGNWWGKGEPIHISSISQDPDIPVGRIKNISFSNITATSEAGAVFYGSGENTIEDITLTNVHLWIKSGTLTGNWGGNFDLRPAQPPKMQQFEHDIPGIYMKNIDRALLRDIQIDWIAPLAPFYTHGVEIEDSKEIDINGLKVTGLGAGYKPLNTVESESVHLDGKKM